MEGRDLPFPKALLAQLGRWHHVSFLRSRETREQMRRLRWTCSAPERVAALEALIEGNLAFHLFEEIERAKQRLSEDDATIIEFHRGEVRIREPLTRVEFEELIAPDQGRILRCMRSVLASAGVSPADVQAVFLTGG